MFPVLVPVSIWLSPVIFVTRWTVYRVFVVGVLRHYSGFGVQLHSPTTRDGGN